MSKYEIARGALADVVSKASDSNVSEDEIMETMIVVIVEAMVKSLGRERVADVLRYELSNIGGTVDTAARFAWWSAGIS